MQHELNKGGFIKNGQMTVVAGSEKMQMSIYDFALKGIHNQYNTMAAGIATATIGIRKQKIREAIESFEALEHRMEYVLHGQGDRIYQRQQGHQCEQYVVCTWKA